MVNKTRELKAAQEEAKYYREKYEDLKNSAVFPLTEKTGRQLLLVAEGGKKKINHSTEEEAEIKIGTTRGEEIYVGFGHWAKKIAFDEAHLAKKPSIFVLTLVYGLQNN